MRFLRVKNEKVPRTKRHGYAYSWESKVAYDFVFDYVIMFVNVGLDNSHSKILINMTPEEHINTKTHAIVDSS